VNERGEVQEGVRYALAAREGRGVGLRIGGGQVERSQRQVLLLLLKPR
jgi:hypothetical protein